LLTAKSLLHVSTEHPRNHSFNDVKFLIITAKSLALDGWKYLSEKSTNKEKRIHFYYIKNGMEQGAL
jgi:hypothetical protein